MDTFILEAEERSSVRRAVGTECQVVSSDGFSLVAQRTLDVSPDGLLAPTECLPVLGSELFVSLRIPGTRLWVGAEATACRLVRARRRGEWTPAVGIRFTRIDPVERAMLRGHLWGKAPTVATRSPRRDYAEAVRRIARG